MLQNRFRLATTIASLAVIASCPAISSAQIGGGTMQLNIAAGAAVPTSTFGSFTDVGYNLTVGIGARQRNSQLGFRAEGMYNEFGISNSSSKANAGGVIGNVTVDLANAGVGAVGNSLYIIGGVGYYSTSDFAITTGTSYYNSGYASQNNWNVGYNIGGGFRFPLSGFSAYLEARYHTVSNADVKFVPIVFGRVF